MANTIDVITLVKTIREKFFLVPDSVGTMLIAFLTDNVSMDTTYAYVEPIRIF